MKSMRMKLLNGYWIKWRIKLIDLKKKKAFLFDIDGTLSVGTTLFDGSSDLLEYIETIGGKAYYITNNSTASTSDYIEKFAKWGIKTDASQFVTAGNVSINYLLDNYADKLIYVVGTASYVNELKRHGLQVCEEVNDECQLVLVAFDNELRYEKLYGACKLLSEKKIPFLATNPDLCCPAPFGFVPDCGSICMMIENSVDAKAEYLGKPNKCVVEMCLNEGGFTKEESIVLGDRLYTDIACGINAGVDTCALLTGETTLAEIETSDYKPDLVFNNIRDFFNELTK